MKIQSEREKELIKMISAAGFPLWGFCSVKGLLPGNLSDLNYGISVSLPISNKIMQEVEINQSPTHTYFHRYRTINTFIDQRLLELTLLIEDWGYETYAVPASQSVNKNDQKYRGIFQHRTVATRSGIGWIGKNGSIVTKKYGPRIRLGSVLTNMPLVENKPIREGLCGKCRICVNLCPASALSGENWDERQSSRIYDPKACSDHMKNHYKGIGRGSVCGICIASCPVGKP